MYEVGCLLTNAIEVSSKAVTVEVMHRWVDPEDDDVQYIIKCRKVDRLTGVNSMGAWYYEDELDLVCEFHLDKYYERVN